jgi:hypothetical protein
MAILTKAQLQAANSSSFPNNNSQAITPQILRDYNSSVIDTLVDSLDTGSFARTDITNDFTQTNNFTSISASSFVSASNFVGDGSKLTNVTASIALPILDEGILQGYATSMNFTGSAISAQVIAGTAVVQVNIDNVGLVTTASFNAYTQSTNTAITNLNASSASQQISINALNQSSASQQVSINALNVYTASQDSSSIVNSITELNTFSASAKIELVNLNTSVTNLNSFSSSTNSSITQLNASTASQQVSINNLNTTTASLLIETQNLELFSASALISISNLNQSSASQQVSINSLNAATASYVTETESGSFLLTASFDNGTRNLTFTKGNNTTFAVNIPDVSGSAGDFVTTASFNSYTQSNDQRVSSLEAATSSYVTESETASFARTNVDNNFTANQTFTNITATSASITYLTTLYETASVIYSSGSNQLGDELTDIQTLSGSVKVQGSLTVNGTPVQTSSVDISALNQATASLQSFTQSAQISINALNTNSASVNTSISALNTFTASQSTASLVTSITELNTFSASALVSISNLNTTTASLNTSASLALVTASFDTGTRNLTFTKGDTTTFAVNIPDVSGSAGNFVTTASFNAYTASNDQKVNSLISATGSYATTGSNVFVGNQTITGSINISGSINMVNGADLVTHHVRAQGSNGLELQTSAGTNIVQMGAGGGTQAVFVGAVSANSVSASTINGLGDPLAFSTSVDSRLDSLEGITASVNTSASLALYTASFDTGSRNLTFTKGDTTTFAVNIPDVSGSTIDTGSFATTGSNSFIGNQTVNGVVSISSSATYDLDITGAFQATAASRISGSNGIASISQTTVQVTSGSGANLVSSIMARGYVAATSASNQIALYGGISSIGGFGSGKVGGGIAVSSGSAGTYYFPIEFQASTAYTDGRVTFTTPLSASAGFTASLQNGYAWVGNSLGQNTQVLTSSFAGATINTGSFVTTSSFNEYTASQSTGSLVTSITSLNTFTSSVVLLNANNRITGSQIMSGSLTITGSAFGNVVSMSITSNTASMDLSLGNYFTLTLAGTATTHISASNVQPGTSATLVITTGTNSSASLAPTMLQPSGSAYSATNGSGKKDVLSIVAVASGVPFVVSTKNMI